LLEWVSGELYKVIHKKFIVYVNDFY
jgi:hypothetical protein